MEDLSERVKSMARAMELHMVYEYPQIDSVTRVNLAEELALILVGVY